MDVSAILALALGAGVTALVAALAVLLQRWRASKNPISLSVKPDLSLGDLRDFDVSSIDFMELRTWSESKPLNSSSIAETIELFQKPRQEWVEQTGLDQALVRVETAGKYGPACSLVSFESNNVTPRLQLRIIRDSYANYVAVREYLQAEDRMARVRAYVQQHSVEEVIAHAPLSVIALNVTIMAEGSLLLMRRSNAVSTFRGYWQAGPHKSLGFRSDGRPENAIDLAHRALREEAGLEPGDYSNNITFSWFGMYLREATPYLFAHVSTGLTKQEVERRVVSATSAYETADGGERVDWLPLTVDSIEAITDTWRVDPSGQSDSLGRRYLPHAVIGLRQLTRVLESNKFMGEE